jgi:hypothetical protein
MNTIGLQVLEELEPQVLRTVSAAAGSSDHDLPGRRTERLGRRWLHDGFSA